MRREGHLFPDSSRARGPQLIGFGRRRGVLQIAGEPAAGRAHDHIQERGLVDVPAGGHRRTS